MKRIVNALVAAAMLGWAFLADAHDVEVVLYPTIGPVSVPSYGINSPSFGAFAAKSLYALQNGRRGAGGSILVTPTAFNTIGAPILNRSGKLKVSAYDTWATKEVHLGAERLSRLVRSPTSGAHTFVSRWRSRATTLSRLRT
jgi:hypothetical protein